MIEAISDWVDDHVDATIQHIVICAVFIVILGWLFGLMIGTIAGISFGFGFAIGWNTSREVRDAQKGSGFGWRTLLIPDALCLGAFALIMWRIL